MVWHSLTWFRMWPAIVTELRLTPIGQSKRKPWESRLCRPTQWMFGARRKQYPCSTSILLTTGKPERATTRDWNPSSLEHTYRWLKAGGVLLFAIPQLRLAKCARLLSEHFTDLRVFRLTEPACLQYKQIVVLATRRKRHARLSDAALLDGVRYLEALATKAELEPLGDNPEVQYEVPASEPVVLTNLGIPLDEVENLLLESAAYRQAGRVLLPKLKTSEAGRSHHCTVDMSACSAPRAC